MKSKFENCYRRLNRAGEGLQSPFLLLVRLYWGWQLMQTGWGKINNIPRVTAFFTELGIPFPGLNAQFIAGLELAGGILLILGLASRLIALPLTINMLVAYITADREALFSVVSDPDKFYAAAPFTFLIASLIVLLFGPGRFAVDTWIARRRESITGQSLQGASIASVPGHRPESERNVRLAVDVVRSSFAVDFDPIVDLGGQSPTIDGPNPLNG